MIKQKKGLRVGNKLENLLSVKGKITLDTYKKYPFRVFNALYCNGSFIQVSFLILLDIFKHIVSLYPIAFLCVLNHTIMKN